MRNVILPQLEPIAHLYLGNVARCATYNKMAIPARAYKSCLPYTLSDFTTLLTTYPRLYLLCLGAPAATHMHLSLTGTKVSQKDAFLRNGTTYTHAPTKRDWTFFATYHPAAVLRSPPKIHPVSDHVAMLVRHITGEAPVVSTPKFVSLRVPSP